MCGKPRLAFCCPFKFKIQSAGLQQELRPHRGAGTNSSSWHTWRYPFLLFRSRLLLPLPLLPLTPDFPPPPSPFVHPPKPAVQGSDAVCYRRTSQEMPRQSTKLRRESVRLSAKENEAQEETETVKRMYLNLE